MQAVVRQSEAHQDRGNAQMTREIADDRNRSAGSDEYGRPPSISLNALRGRRRSPDGPD